MANIAQAAREPEEVRDLNLGAQRMCVIELKDEYRDQNGDPKPIRLAWHTGIPSPSTRGTGVRKTLWPGERYRVPLERAQAWFGLFTLPHILDSVYDERKRETLLEQYETERNRAIMSWGEYPRGNTGGPINNNGGNPIGPARIPPVVLTVEEADGSTWAPVDLRELYELGEYWDVEIPTAQIRRAGPDPNEKRDEEIGGLKLQLARLEGMLLAFNQRNEAPPPMPEPPPMDANGQTDKRKAKEPASP